ncbi:AzlC family ABC transporter permease [Arhodomonas sp. SL1]|uniref:AzlC family ABC transporter permease n=1 Tax=Arhodomonas sp. SL1 TaxID=3425691 RepID=UPI003F8825B9
MRRGEAFKGGMLAMGPITASAVPFGVMAGIAAREAGLDVIASMGMSLFIFAGASQLAAAQLINDGAWAGVIILTALVINLRFAMYSASLAPHLAHLPTRWKAPLAYLLTDQAYAVCITRFMKHPDMDNRHWFYLGAAMPLWLVWLAATAAGILIGAAVPPAWQLGFAVPLIFLALLVPAVHDRPMAVAAVVGGGIALAAHNLPFNLGMITGALAGVVAGVLAERWQARWAA